MPSINPHFQHTNSPPFVHHPSMSQPIVQHSMSQPGLQHPPISQPVSLHSMPQPVVQHLPNSLPTTSSSLYPPFAPLPTMSAPNLPTHISPATDPVSPVAAHPSGISKYIPIPASRDNRSTFSPTGRKRAVISGVNYVDTREELKGCVRDATFLFHLLVSRFHFKPSDIVILTDVPPDIKTFEARCLPPTGENIMRELVHMVRDAAEGDTLFFSFSGHGVQVPDLDGDEKGDGVDEALLPSDFKKGGYLLDDDLYHIATSIPSGARFLAVVDACHSGATSFFFYYYVRHSNVGSVRCCRVRSLEFVHSPFPSKLPFLFLCSHARRVSTTICTLLLVWQRHSYG